MWGSASMIWLGRTRAAALGWSSAALLLGELVAGSVRAQPATPTPHAVLLTAARADAPSNARPRGVFEQRTLTITLESAQVRLASTPDGAGALCTDDRAMLTLISAAGTTHRWTYQFASPDRRMIVCLPSQALTLPDGAGVYTATLTLEDLYPDTYGTRAYYLVIDAVGAPATTPDFQPEARQEAPAPIPTRAAPQPTPPIATLGAATPAVTAVLPAAPVAVRRAEPSGIGALISDTRVLMGIGAAIALAILVLLGRQWLRRRSRSAPQLCGVLYLFEPATREARTIALSGGATGVAICRQPLRAVPISATGDASAAIAQIQATAGGPVLREGNPPTAQSIPLERDQPYALAGGLVTLRYRDQDARLERGGSHSRRTTDRRSTMR